MLDFAHLGSASMFAFVSQGSSLSMPSDDCLEAEAVVLSFAHVGSLLSLCGLDFAGRDLASFSSVFVCPPEFATRDLYFQSVACLIKAEPAEVLL